MSGTRFGILGHLEVWDGTRRVAVGGPQQATLLALLLLNANRVVSTDRLVDDLWDGAPPDNARRLLHGCVVRLRRVLQRAGDDEQPLASVAPGYRLTVRPGELDLDVFEELAAETPVAQDAAERLRSALALWRGPALDGLTATACQVQARRLDERRQAVLEQRIDADLRLGRYADLIGELQACVEATPLRERLWAQLMVALYGAGRQADALAAYRRLRHTMVEQIGVQPSAAVQDLEHAILTAVEPAEAYRAAFGLPRGEAIRVVPCQLPAAVAAFTGRAESLSQLDECLAGTTGASAVVITALAGTAGVGKTALAVHWAHSVAPRFGDGQLYVNLRGYDPDQPMRPAEALAGFLRALGVDGREIPYTLDERAARYRSLLADRRMLVVLDNANTAEQVRPLLPGSRNCLVLVTSRDSLAGLVARDGAHRIDVDLLTRSEATALLRTLIGDRADAEPAAVAALAEQCARLPLALRVAAEIAQQRPARSLAQLVEELDLLRPGDDEQSAVRTVFGWSYQQLHPAAARMFRRLGLHPGVDVDEHAAAALAGCTLDAAREALDMLVRAHLVTEGPPGRYGMHDLLRTYAAACALEESEPDRHAALIRLLEHYLATAGAAMDVLYPAERHLRPPVQGAAVPDVPLRGWLETERTNLVAAAAMAADHGWHDKVGRLAATVNRYLDLAGHYNDALTVHGHALSSARDHGDLAGQAAAHLHLGGISYYVGRYDEAAAHDRDAATRFRATGDRRGEARALGQLGRVYAQWGRNAEALEHYQRALAMCQAIGERVYGAAFLGWVGLELGRAGRHDEAIDHLRRAVTAHRELGHDMRVIEALTNLGEVYLWAGRHADALKTVPQALAMQSAHEYRFFEAYGHNVLGDVWRALRRPEDALAHYRAALATSRDISRRDEQARALDGIAHVLCASGRAEAARSHWRQALDLYRMLGVPKAMTVQAQLATLGSLDPDGHRRP